MHVRLPTNNALWTLIHTTAIHRKRSSAAHVSLHENADPLAYIKRVVYISHITMTIPHTKYEKRKTRNMFHIWCIKSCIYRSSSRPRHPWSCSWWAPPWASTCRMEYRHTWRKPGYCLHPLSRFCCSCSQKISCSLWLVTGRKKCIWCVVSCFWFISLCGTNVLVVRSSSMQTRWALMKLSGKFITVFLRCKHGWIRSITWLIQSFIRLRS